MRFTIRDLMWLTVVVGLMLCWTIRERQLKSTIANAMQWRGTTGGLQWILEADGWQITWMDGIVDAKQPATGKHSAANSQLYPYRERPVEPWNTISN